jgi:hypothetical protein
VIVVGILLGAAYGALLARRREGSNLDMLHYGGIYAILFGVLAVFLQIGLGRFLS